MWFLTFGKFSKLHTALVCFRELNVECVVVIVIASDVINGCQIKVDGCASFVVCKKHFRF